MNWKEFIKNKETISEQAKKYYSETITQKRHRKTFFETLSQAE